MKKFYKNIAPIFLVLASACNGGISGKVDRATTVTATPIDYILQHPDEFSEEGNTVTIKGKVIESTKIPLWGSSLKVKDGSGKTITVKLPSGSPVPGKGAEVVYEGQVVQGTKVDALGMNNIAIEVGEEN